MIEGVLVGTVVQFLNDHSNRQRTVSWQREKQFVDRLTSNQERGFDQRTR
jgi:hypothetical protein